MKIKAYTLQFDAPMWVKRLSTYVALPVGILLGAALVARGAVTLTTFVANTPISAQEVNGNFSALAEAINGLAPSSSVPKISGWQSYSPSLTTDSGATVASQTTGMYRRVGDSIEVSIATHFSAAPPSGTVFFRWSLPAQLSIDLARVVGGNGALLGSGMANESLLFYSIGAYTVPSGAGVTAVANGGFYVNDKVPAAFDENGGISLRFTLPVSGWTVNTP
jgi:hypothetical protein